MSKIASPKALQKDINILQEQVFDLFGILGELELRMDLIENTMVIHRRSDISIKDAFVREIKSASSSLQPKIVPKEKSKTNPDLEKELKRAIAIIDNL
ncbi:MAG: hypothetical protein ACFFBD_13060 [Candidatus Hodarchaeota archaeon]